MTVADISIIAFIAIIVIILGFAAVLLWKVANSEISLVGLIAEPDAPEELAEDGTVKKKAVKGKASLSRFQMLIFTFVIAGLYLLLSIESGAFVEIPANVLGLIGISSGSYVLSKTVGGARHPSAGGGQGDGNA